MTKTHRACGLEAAQWFLRLRKPSGTTPSPLSRLETQVAPNTLSPRRRPAVPMIATALLTMTLLAGCMDTDEKAVESTVGSEPTTVPESGTTASSTTYETTLGTDSGTLSDPEDGTTSTSVPDSEPETTSGTTSDPEPETSSGTVSDPEPETQVQLTTWYVALQAVDDKGQYSPDSNEASGGLAAGEQVTLVWNAPNMTLDGACTKVDSYLVKLGTRSGQYSHSMSVSAYDRGLSCTATSTNQCGSTYTCEMAVEVPAI